MKKIITSLLTVALFLFSSISFAAVNNNPQFEFGTIPAENCKVLGKNTSIILTFSFAGIRIRVDRKPSNPFWGLLKFFIT